jgi:hypothetical protein
MPGKPKNYVDVAAYQRAHPEVSASDAVRLASQEAHKNNKPAPKPQTLTFTNSSGTTDGGPKNKHHEKNKPRIVAKTPVESVLSSAPNLPPKSRETVLDSHPHESRHHRTSNPFTAVSSEAIKNAYTASSVLGNVYQTTPDATVPEKKVVPASMINTRTGEGIPDDDKPNYLLWVAVAGAVWYFLIRK